MTINWLEKPQKHTFFWYLCKEIRSNTGTWSIDRVWNIFMEKLYRNFALITSAIHSAIYVYHIYIYIYSLIPYIYIYIYDIYIYIYIYTPSSPLFSFCWPLLEKIKNLNPKVYDVINWLKKNLNTHFLISWEEYQIWPFLTAISLYHNQVWVIIKASASLTWY